MPFLFLDLDPEEQCMLQIDSSSLWTVENNTSDLHYVLKLPHVLIFWTAYTVWIILGVYYYPDVLLLLLSIS